MPQGLICNRGRTDVSVPEPQTNLEAGLPSPMLRGSLLQRATSASPAIPEYSEAVEISRYGSQDVHTHYRSVINVIGMLQQLRFGVVLRCCALGNRVTE